MPQDHRTHLTFDRPFPPVREDEVHHIVDGPVFLGATHDGKYEVEMVGDLDKAMEEKIRVVRKYMEQRGQKLTRVTVQTFSTSTQDIDLRLLEP